MADSAPSDPPVMTEPDTRTSVQIAVQHDPAATEPGKLATPPPQPSVTAVSQEGKKAVEDEDDDDDEDEGWAPRGTTAHGSAGGGKPKGGRPR